MTIGIAWVILGIMLMAYTGYDMVVNHELVSVRSIKIRKLKSHLIEWSPVVGLMLFVGGIMVFARAKRNLNKV